MVQNKYKTARNANAVELFTFPITRSPCLPEACTTEDNQIITWAALATSIGLTLSSKLI